MTAPTPTPGLLFRARRSGPGNAREPRSPCPVPGGRALRPLHRRPDGVPARVPFPSRCPPPLVLSPYPSLEATLLTTPRAWAPILGFPPKRRAPARCGEAQPRGPGVGGGRRAPSRRPAHSRALLSAEDAPHPASRPPRPARLRSPARVQKVLSPGTQRSHPLRPQFPHPGNGAGRFPPGHFQLDPGSARTGGDRVMEGSHHPSLTWLHVCTLPSTHVETQMVPSARPLSGLLPVTPWCSVVGGLKMWGHQWADGWTALYPLGSAQAQL